jgi:hypothetical protein
MRTPFDPPPGLTDDDTTFSSPGRWADGSNIRFRKLRPEAIGAIALADIGTLSGACRAIKGWTQNDGQLVTAFGTHSKLQVYANGALADVTPAGLTAGSIDNSGSAPGYGTGGFGSGLYSVPASVFWARTWHLDTWGETLLASPRGGTLYQWENDPGIHAAAITQAPDEISAILVTAERQVLALGCNEEGSGSFNPLCIRGCDLEDLADWTTAADNNAFEHILEGSGAIVTGRRIGPYVAVWTNVGLYLGQFVGAPGQAYRFDPVAMGCGIIGPNAVQVVGQTAYWVGTDKQVRAWSPGGQPLIVPCPILDDFTDNLEDSQAAKLTASSLSRFEEVWFHYPDARDGIENSRYIAFSLSDGGPLWFRGSMERTAFVDAGVASYPMGADADGLVYYHEHPDGSPVTWTLTSADTYVGEGDRVAEVQRFIPDFEEQDSDVSLTLTMRKDPRSDAVTKGPYTIGVTDTKRDFRAAGRIMAVALSGTGAWRMGKPEFEVVLRGAR